VEGVEFELAGDFLNGQYAMQKALAAGEALARCFKPIPDEEGTEAGTRAHARISQASPENAEDCKLSGGAR